MSEPSHLAHLLQALRDVMNWLTAKMEMPEILEDLEKILTHRKKRKH